MATRNRTSTYVKYRDTARGQQKVFRVPGVSSGHGDASLELSDMSRTKLLAAPDGSNRANGGASTAKSATEHLPPAWVDLSDAIAEEMVVIRSRMAELAKAHEKALRPTFDDSSNQQAVSEAEALQQDITRRLKRCEAQLHKLSARDQSADAAVRKNVQRRVATELSELSMQFLAYARLLQATTGVGAAFEVEEKPRDDSHGQVIDMGFSEQALMVVHHADGLAVERESEINKIVQSVNDLAQVMQDLSVLVIDQGTILDRIDYNVEQVHQKVEEGLQQLKRADQTQKKSRMFLCIMLLLVMCLVMLVILIAKKILIG
eukprot:jgi/Chlat1/5520/Chrsp369S00408